MRTAPVQGSTNQLISYACRTLFNALINGNRGYQAPWVGDDGSISTEAAAMLGGGGPHILMREPAVAIGINPVPQANDMVHAASLSRMLPCWSPESTSGGWVALPYAFDPPPDIPDIVIPQAQWQEGLGDVHLTGLLSAPRPAGMLGNVFGDPMPGFAYPGVIGTGDNVTSTGTL